MNALQHNRYGSASRRAEWDSLMSLGKGNLGEAIGHLKMGEGAMRRKLALPRLSKAQHEADELRLRAFQNEIVQLKMELYEKSKNTIEALRPLIEKSSES